MKRNKSMRELPTLLPFLKARGRFMAGKMTAADRQLIALVLAKVASGDDVRTYFFETVDHRPPAHDSRKWLAAMLWAIADARDDKRGKRGKTIERRTRLTKNQVADALRTHRDDARETLELWGLDFADQWARARLDELDEQERAKLAG